jgi:hypothetical protein
MAEARQDEGLLGLLAGLSPEGGDGAELAPPPPQPVVPQGRRVTPEELKKWAIIYPCYLDPSVTVDKGRRLPLHKLTGCAFTRPSSRPAHGDECSCPCSRHFACLTAASFHLVL